MVSTGPRLLASLEEEAPCSAGVPLAFRCPIENAWPATTQPLQKTIQTEHTFAVKSMILLELPSCKILNQQIHTKEAAILVLYL